jgi:GDPmannose 4,6-dehydratase
MKRALITGITGQDGSYLAELLLEKGYIVFGLARAESWSKPNHAQHLSQRIHIVLGNINERSDIENALQISQPDEIYNLASQSRPSVSWMRPGESLQVNGMVPVELFEGVRNNHKNARLYHASSSEMFGNTMQAPQNELSPLEPSNPYAAAKIYAHHMARIYRDSYGLYIASGILFNHESERRGLSFVTQKVAYGAACASLGIKTSPDLNEVGFPIVENGCLVLGNLEVERDWGYAPDYVEAMWLILQQDKPTDFVIGTGQLRSLRELCDLAYGSVGFNWRDCIMSDPQLVRPLEPSKLVADTSKAYSLLGWKAKMKFEDMISRMVRAQIERLKSSI